MDWDPPAVKSRHSCLMLAQCLCFINSKCLVAMVTLLIALERRATHRVVMCKGSLWKADRQKIVLHGALLAKWHLDATNVDRTSGMCCLFCSLPAVLHVY